MKRKILKIFLYTLGGVAALLVLLTGVFYLNRDWIGEKLLLKTNELHQGKVSFSDISFSPFIHFPDMSVKLKDVQFLAGDPRDSLQYSDTIASFNKIFVAADLWSLFSGRVVVSGITVSDGILRLSEYPDSTLNLVHALEPSGKGPKITGPDEKDTLAEGKSFELSLERVYFRNVLIHYKRAASADTLRAGIESMDATLEYLTGEITGGFRGDISIKELGFLNEKRLGSIPVEINTRFAFNRESRVLSLDQADLKIRTAIFYIRGGLVFTEPVRVDLSLEASSSDMSFFRAWLSEKGISNLKSGESYFSGTISGEFGSQIPEMNFVFGLRNVDLDIPGVNEHVRDLGLSGSFQSGTKPDFSGAMLEIKEVKGYLPGGHLNGNLVVHDFAAPAVSLLWDMETDVTGLDEVLNLQGIDSLTGRIQFYDRAEGRYDPNTKTWSEKENESRLMLDSLSMDIAGFGFVSNLSGNINRNHDTLNIRELCFFSGNSDFRVNGNVNNLLYLFTESDEAITADLKIISDTFDLPAFLAFDPRVGESFPYRILGIDLDVSASSTRDKLLNFQSNPEIEFGIEHLRATIENLFPQVVMQSGLMVMAEKDGRVHLTFDDFLLSVAEGDIRSDVVYHSRSGLPDHLEVDAEITGLDLAMMFFGAADSVPQIATGHLSTSTHASLDLGMDSLDFSRISLDMESLEYQNEKDTIKAKGLVLQAQDVRYSRPGNPLATLTASIDLQAREVLTNYFHVEDVAYAIDAGQGNYMVYPEKVQFFGKEGEGVYELSPFADNPTYKLKYKVSAFPVETFLQKILKDTLLTGLMDIDLDVIIDGWDKNNTFSGLNGYASLHGRNMTIYGIDLDKLIAKYQKSQKFSLVDLGAVALAGPVGLAITKGSELANLAIGSFGEATGVVEMVSEWECENGRFTMKDVAFTTAENLVAGKGWIDLAADSLNITVSVLNKYRCTVVSQSVYGKLESPEQSDVDIVGTVLGPITNLIDGSQGKGCKPFYNGRLKHPLAEKKKTGQ